MKTSPTYASVALIGRLPNGRIGVETIAIDGDGASLAGAWDYEEKEIDQVKILLVDKFVMAIDSRSEALLDEISEKKFNLKILIVEIAKLVEMIEIEFKDYVAADTKKRSKLKEPDLKLVKIETEKKDYEVIEEKIKDRTHDGLDQNFMKMILAAWVIRDLISKWQFNERERVARKYLNCSTGTFRILPERIFDFS